MEHLALQHTMRGQTLRTSRPDFELFRYLWQRRLIDDREFNDLKSGNHNLTRPPPSFLIQANDRSRRDTPRRRGLEQPVRQSAPPTNTSRTTSDPLLYGELPRTITSPSGVVVHNTAIGPGALNTHIITPSGVGSRPYTTLEQSPAGPPGFSQDHDVAAVDPLEQNPTASVEGRDSGYGTMSNSGPNHSSRDDDAGSVRTMISDASLVFQPPKEREDLISAFVDDLREALGLSTMDLAQRTRIVEQLSGLLKTFSLRLGNGAVLSQHQQDAKNFIRQQRE
jgi:hypothetical protein